jgi:hypothetical protein
MFPINPLGEPKQMDRALAEQMDSRELDPDPADLLGSRRRGGVREYTDALIRDPCAYCGATPPRHGASVVDHIHARARGGPDRWWNYTAACGYCNHLKYDESPLATLLMLDWSVIL